MIWIAALALAHATSNAPHNVMVYGPQPSPSCGAWTSARTNKADFVAVQYQMWVLGLVTGLNWNGPPMRSEGPDAQALFAWVDQYCSAHPLDLVISAAIRLSHELESRDRR